MFKKILHPVSLSEQTSSLKKRCVFIDKFGGRELILLHVLNPGISNELHARSKLDSIVNDLQKSNINARYKITSGSTASEVVAASLNEKADVIYMPASTKNILVSTLLGSVTDDVIRLSDIPIFVHKQRPALKAHESVQQVLFATDFAEAAQRAWPHVSRLGRFIPELIILHVGQRASDPLTEQLRRERVEEKLDELKAKFQSDYENIRHFSRIGSPSKHIIAAAEQEKSDLVILGRINEPFPSRILGSTCARVTSGVKSSVLLIP
ncbi:universal stress protein [Desulfonatronovibrio magnus]|uniref:universal stress protein n=1 Tax=Desulfonatronovibrio magnus TaxID=698827 RepID=UPI0005EBDE5B|nr:universal stress protein [Desulfonatronovibrio magnus]